MEDRLKRLERLVANAENIAMSPQVQPTRERVEHWKAAAQTRGERLAILRPSLSNAAKSTSWHLFLAGLPVSDQATPIARALHTKFADAWKNAKVRIRKVVYEEFIDFLEGLATHPSIRSVRPGGNVPWTSDAIVSLALKHLPHIREVKHSEELEGMMERISFKRYWEAQLEEMFHVLEPALQQLQEGEIPEVYPAYPPPKASVVVQKVTASASETALSDDESAAVDNVKPSSKPPTRVAKRKRKRKQKASADSQKQRGQMNKRKRPNQNQANTQVSVDSGETSEEEHCSAETRTLKLTQIPNDKIIQPNKLPRLNPEETHDEQRKQPISEETAELIESMLEKIKYLEGQAIELEQEKERLENEFASVCLHLPHEILFKRIGEAMSGSSGASHSAQVEETTPLLPRQLTACGPLFDKRVKEAPAEIRDIIICSFRISTDFLREQGQE